MAYLNSKPRTPKVCPVCREDVPPKALACPECGSDHNTGWKKGAMDTAGLDLPDEEEFDYDDFVAREFGEGTAKRKGVGAGTGLKPIWWITGVLLLIALVVAVFFGG